MSKFTSCQMGIPRLGSTLFLLYIPANWSSYLGLTPQVWPHPAHEAPQGRMGSDSLYTWNMGSAQRPQCMSVK